MANNIQVFKSTNTGAPVLTGEVGKLIALLLTCLVDGYATASVTSITRSGTTATVTLASANATLVTGDWVTISGAVETDYNGSFQITVSSSTVFTYTVANSPTTPATGTILYNKSGAGWTQPFTGSNKAAFRGGATNNSAQFYLQVIDDGSPTGGALNAAVRGYESMSDVDNGTGDCPTVASIAAGLCWRKSATANSTARDWVIVADDRAFYLQINANATVGTTSTNFFGWFPSYKSGDAFNCALCASSVFNSASSAEGISNKSAPATFTSVAYDVIARSYSQIGSAITARTVSFSAAGAGSVGNNATTILYPNPQDSALWVTPLLQGEGGNSIRGRYPGAYEPLHTGLVFSNLDKATNIVGLTGITLLSLDAKNNTTAGQILIDITGPWS
jgi:hypothetical protein